VNISKGCFFGCDFLRDIVFETGSKLKEIGRDAFRNTKLRAIRIPRSVENIEEFCFYGCKSLSELVFESGSELKKIGDYAFCKSGLRAIRIPRNIENIGIFCFSGSMYLTEVTFMNAPCIGTGAFDECPLTYVNVPNGVVLKYDFPKSCTFKENDSS
jgi:hypothetical protein